MSEDSIPQKRCPKCEEIKPLEMFGKHKGKKDGLTSWCKQCLLSKPKIDVITVQPAEKRCKKCCETKPIELFYRNKRNQDGTHAQCKKCQLEVQKAYQDTKRDALKIYLRAWRAANREHHRSYNRAWYYAHPEHCSKRSRAWHIANIERKREYDRACSHAHPDVIRAKVQRRLARIKGNGGTFTHKELTAMRIAQAGVCAYCKWQHDPDALTIDHIITVQYGGRHARQIFALHAEYVTAAKAIKHPNNGCIAGI